MKKIAIAAIAVFLLAASVSAQTFAEFSAEIKDGKATPIYDGQVQFGKTQGVQVWGLATEGWSELYLMYFRSLKPWVSVSAGAGVEQTEGHWRIGGTVWMGKGKFSTFLAFEDGASGFWYTYKGTFALTSRISGGLFSRRYVGTGPLVEVKVIGKTSLWTTYCPRSAKAMIGLQQGF